jgi:hypothetical protein
MADSNFNLSQVNGSNGFTFQNSESNISDPSVSDARDINGDGIEDLIVGGKFGDPD